MIKNLEAISGYRVQNKHMRIGQLATRAGVNVQTIRFYERRRILTAPPRTVSGYRRYAESDTECVSIVPVA